MSLPNWFTLRYLAFGGGKPLLLPMCHSGYSYREENLLMHLYMPARVTKLKNPPVSLFISVDRDINGIYYLKYSFYTIRCIRDDWRAAVKQELSVLYAFHTHFVKYELDPSQLGFGTSWPPSVTFCPNLSPILHLPTHLHIQCAVKLQYQLYRLVYIIKITKVYSYWNNGFYNGLRQPHTRPRCFQDYTFAYFPENKTLNCLSIW